jgi:hypothetical protein
MIDFFCGNKENLNIKIVNRSFENMAKYKHLGRTGKNQNFIHDEIKSTLNSSKACYHSDQDSFSSRLQSKIVKTKIYKIIILYECETSSLTLWEDPRRIKYVALQLHLDAINTALSLIYAVPSSPLHTH